MRNPIPTLVLCLLACAASAAERHRAFILTDIGNEPDDSESMVRLLTYSNQLDLEGLIATTSRFLRTEVRTHLITERLDAYAQVRGNLLLHESGFPTVDYLRSITAAHVPRYGMLGVGAGNDSPGSEKLIAAVDRADARPLYVSIWGGPNCLAHALWKVRATRTAAQVDAFVRKLRVFAIEDQDDSGTWIRANFPQLFYMYGWSWRGISSNGGDASLTDNAWVDRHVQAGHGPLGAKYPDIAYIMEGDTPSWLYLLPFGLNDPAQPTWGSWGGRYGGAGPVYGDVNDTFNGQTSIYATVYRWRLHYQNDFEARMDWNVRPFATANHPPVAVLQGAAFRTVAAGSVVALSAAGSSDPDGNALSYEWIHYDEPGTHDGAIAISGANQQQASFIAPQVTSPKTIHVVLVVRDNGAPNLFRYRRVVVTVTPSGAPSVSAGPDLTVTLPGGAALDGSASDDGRPSPLSTSWSRVSGPGVVTFANAAAIDTTATFSAAGAYVLRLSASDGAESRSDDMTVTAYPPGSYARAINLNGGAVTFDGRSWLAYDAATSQGLSVSPAPSRATTAVAPVPAVDAGGHALLNSAIWSGEATTVAQTLPNGAYEVRLWVMENHQANFRAFDVALEGASVATGIGDLPLGAWRAYGPYRADVADGRLDVRLVPRRNHVHLMGMTITGLGGDGGGGGSGSGTILRQWWNGIAGNEVGLLANDARFPDSPSGSEQRTLFEGPTDAADAYGSRLVGYVHAPSSGAYTFWIAGDDNCELWLSSDDSSANRRLIARVPGWTTSRQWDRYPEQRSVAIQLVGGRRYFIEALHKEGAGGDNVAVGWQRPDGIQQRPIAGSFLSPYVPVATPQDRLVAGIACNGPALTIAREEWSSWAAAQAAGLTTTAPNRAQTAVTPAPGADAPTTTLLNGAIWGPGDWTLRRPLANGSYDVYLWVMENHLSNHRAFDVRLEGTTVATSIGTMARGAWRRYGPYRVTVGDGALDLGMIRRFGDPHLMGLEIRTPTPTGTASLPAAPRPGRLGASVAVVCAALALAAALRWRG